MSKVLQAKLKAQEASDGQLKFSALQMGMSVPYRMGKIHPVLCPIASYRAIKALLDAGKDILYRFKTPDTAAAQYGGTDLPVFLGAFKVIYDLLQVFFRLVNAFHIAVADAVGEFDVDLGVGFAHVEHPYT